MSRKSGFNLGNTDTVSARLFAPGPPFSWGSGRPLALRCESDAVAAAPERRPVEGSERPPLVLSASVAAGIGASSCKIMNLMNSV